jgi:hypothetical protein
MMFNPLFGFLSQKADAQQQKDLRRMEAYMVESCVA